MKKRLTKLALIAVALFAGIGEAKAQCWFGRCWNGGYSSYRSYDYWSGATCAVGTCETQTDSNATCSAGTCSVETNATCDAGTCSTETNDATCSTGTCATNRNDGWRCGYYRQNGRLYYGWYRLATETSKKVEETPAPQDENQSDDFVPEYTEASVSGPNLSPELKSIYDESEFFQKVYEIGVSDLDEATKGARIGTLTDQNAKELYDVNRVCLFNALLGRLLSVEERVAVDETNELRRERGLFPLFIDLRLTRAARSHSVDMERRGYFSHYTWNSTPWSRAAQCGTSCSGENIAGVGSGSYAVRMWRFSGGHYSNIVGAHRRIGVGCSNRNSTQMFGR